MHYGLLKPGDLTKFDKIKIVTVGKYGHFGLFEHVLRLDQLPPGPHFYYLQLKIITLVYNFFYVHTRMFFG